ncbi:hypothetical protein LGK97_08120 [Clostridium sp. CS001]|uniref:CsxC family protein n=1 Tax=Clostridium sp. CS001 TaxID=2880648 RepID=UPI001CF22822|nr:hypothetical protein [Clostridium sp. CS001]MCB2289729.1 hypothetical protein [Clostridium sp. CS001]
MCSRHHPRVYDKNGNKKEDDGGFNNIDCVKLEDTMKENYNKEHEDVQNKKMHKKEHHKKHHKNHREDNHQKKTHSDNHHKNHDDYNLHKRKHVEKHLEKDHNEIELEKNRNRNIYLKNWLVNFLKAYSGDFNNNFFLERKRKPKETNLFKQDSLKGNPKRENEYSINDNPLEVNMGSDLEVNIEEENYNLCKNHELKNKQHDDFEDLNEEDSLKKMDNNIIKGDCSKENYDNIEDEDYLKEDGENIKEGDFPKESQDDFKEDCTKENYDSTEEEDYSEESIGNIQEGDFVNESYDNSEGDYLKEGYDNVEYEGYLEESYNNTKEDLPKEIYKEQVDEYTIINCKTEVISETLPTCHNVPYNSEVTVGPVIAKVPVVLIECTVEIAVESSLKLEDAILEIKNIKKNVYLSQCQLIQSSEDYNSNTGMIFLDGFIKSDIEYTTKVHNHEGGLYGEVKYVTVKVPFKCTTVAMFKTYPQFRHSTNQDKMKILETSIKVYDDCGGEITGRDMREQSFKILEVFNEKVFCELISAEIIESSILENPIDEECKITLQQGFHHIAEKVVLLLTIKLLQNQNVEISKKDEK